MQQKHSSESASNFANCWEHPNQTRQQRVKWISAPAANVIACGLRRRVAAPSRTIWQRFSGSLLTTPLPPPPSLPMRPSRRRSACEPVDALYCAASDGEDAAVFQRDGRNAAEWLGSRRSEIELQANHVSAATFHVSRRVFKLALSEPSARLEHLFKYCLCMELHGSDTDQEALCSRQEHEVKTEGILHRP